MFSLIARKLIRGDKLNVGKYFLAANQIVGDYARDEHVLTTDIGVPLSNLEKALELVDEMTETYPLWICPSKDNYHPDKIFCTRKMKTFMFIITISNSIVLSFIKFFINRYFF